MTVTAWLPESEPLSSSVTVDRDAWSDPTRAGRVVVGELALEVPSPVAVLKKRLPATKEPMPQSGVPP